MNALTKLKALVVAEVGADDRARDAVWVTRERRRVPVPRMEDAHLLNTIRMLRGNSPIGTRFICSEQARRRWLRILREEAYARGLHLERCPAKR